MLLIFPRPKGKVIRLIQREPISVSIMSKVRNLFSIYAPMPSSMEQPIISRPFPNAVIYDLSEPYQTTITLPPGSTWSSGLHWHESHTEYLQVIQGAIEVVLEGQTHIFRAKDPSPGSDGTTVCIPRNAWHQWQRAPGNVHSEALGANENLEKHDVVVVERTEPADVEKSVFFWNINGAILSAESARKTYKCPEEQRPPLISTVVSMFQLAMIDTWMMFVLLLIFRDLDNFPVLLNLRFPKQLKGIGRKLDVLFTHCVLELAAFAGALCGIKAVRTEFTPLQLLKARSTTKSNNSQKSE